MPEAQILLVEDNSQDVLLITEALKDAALDHALKVVRDGEEALQTLYSVSFRPHVILLDLNLPKRTGLEVLREIKKDPSLRPLPVIVLTNSRSEDDVILAHASYCNAYVRKPLDYNDLVETMRSLGEFWFHHATLPKPGVVDMTIPPTSD